MPEPWSKPPPLVCYEDEHLLVVNKPAGLNTHAPSPYAGEGIYEWLRHREARWGALGIIHRLDKETSGVMVFAKSTLAKRSLTDQFTRHTIRKKYQLVTDRQVPEKEITVVSSLVRAGERYVSRPVSTGADRAETRFRVIGREGGKTILEAEPVTGRTHQIRSHAASRGLPILGDTLYGGTEAPRVHLHAQEIVLQHPESQKETAFRAPVDFEMDPHRALRAAFFDPEVTNAFRLIHGAADDWQDWYVTQLGDFLLSQSEGILSATQREFLEQNRSQAVYHQVLNRNVRRAAQTSPMLTLGQPAPARFEIRENGLRYEMSFEEGYSVGLFLDQRDNRRRFLSNHIATDFPLFEPATAGKEVLNAFSYTCAFSVCAAKAGARVTSIDLSKKYLEWGRRNFLLNELDSAAHEYIYGDVFDWLRRWTRRKRLFDAIVLDPPTFSHSKESGAFTAERDFGKLIAASLPVLKPNGVLLASTNAARLTPEAFIEQIDTAARLAHRKILQHHYVPQPPDFPITREEPGYLKTLWARVA
jgi:23S rRNA (cytosine1962-C5)-methyltransferase